MKTELTFKESAHLIELGIDFTMASISNSSISTSGAMVIHPIFTLTDILEILPKEIEVYCEEELIPLHLDITTSGLGNWEVSYSEINTLKTAPELIDALYRILIWCIENGHYSPKNEKK